MKKKVEEILIELGVTPNLLGFDYICRFVDYVSENKSAKTGVIYSHIAKECDSTYWRVERSIRHTISKMDKESETYKKYIGTGNTTNSAVLFTLAMRLKED